MPRANPTRSLASEANLARRLAFEREKRGLSYEVLARLMTEAGCPIQGSALFRIEKGNKPPGEEGNRPRRIVVDELVAMATVFGVPVADMLEPMELVEQRQAKEIIGRMEASAGLLGDALEKMRQDWIDWTRLTLDNPDLGDYIHSHLASGDSYWADVLQRVAHKIADDDEEFESRIYKACQTIVAAMQWAGMAEVAPERTRGGKHGKH